MVSPEQSPITSAVGRTWDVAIVGAGPAGGIAAIRLSRDGHRVLLIDRDRFPRQKVCGEGLINDSIQCLERIGIYGKVSSAGHSMGAASVFSPSLTEVEVPARYLTIRRATLDSIVVQEAVDSGATFCSGKVEHVEQDRSAVLLSLLGEKEKLRARYCLIATGADISLARRLNMMRNPAPSAVAVRCYVRSDHALDRLVGFYDRALLPGYGWIFPMGSGLFNMGVILFRKKRKNASVNIRRSFEKFTQDFPLARQIVRRGRGATRLAGGSLRCGLGGCRSLNEGRVLLAGEVAGTTLPFTGEGIGKAMESGEIAAQALDGALRADSRERLDSFSEMMDKRLRPVYSGYEIAQSWLSVPYLTELLSRRTLRSPRLHDAVVNIVTAQADPRKVFSVRGIWDSIWG